MGRIYDALDASLNDFIHDQRLFFVATAPRSDTGKVNVSPKGLDTLRVIGPTRVAYLDYTGSGVETIAHLRENGRITIMFCAFTGPPRILRLYGRGNFIEPGDAEFGELRAAFSTSGVARAIIRVDITRIADSCGFGVPLFEFVGERDQLLKWSEKKSADAIATYQREKNARSLDGLPGLRFPGLPDADAPSRTDAFRGDERERARETPR